MKKIMVILILCTAVLVAAAFGVRRLGQTKKIVNISVTELNSENSGNDFAEKTPEQESIVDNRSVEEPMKKEEITAVPEQVVVQEEKTAPIKKEEAVVEKEITASGKILQKFVSWGFTKSAGRKIDTVIIHTSYNSLGGEEYDASKIIDIYKQYDVSAHYLILRDGTIYQLVADQNIAWHA